MKHLFDENVSIQDLLQPRHNVITVPVVPSQAASLEAHVKLQQHQEEFLAWLEAQEDQDEKGNGYSYRKIR